MVKTNKVTTIAILEDIFLIGFQCQVSLPASEVSDPKLKLVTQNQLRLPFVAEQLDFPTV